MMAESIVFAVWMLVAIGLLVFVWLAWRTLKEQAQFKRTLDMVMLQVAMPKDISTEEREEVTIETIREKISVAEQWLATLSKLPVTWKDRWWYGRPMIALEIAARGDGMIAFYVGAERRYADHLEKQIYALYPEAEVIRAREYTLFESGDTVRAGVVKLSKQTHLPIATYRELEADPMQAMTGAMARLPAGDAAVMQLIVRSSRQKVRKKGQKAARRTIQGIQGDVGGSQVLKRTGDVLTKTEGQREKAEQKAAQLTPRSNEKVELVEAKVSQQQFDVNIRVAVAAREEFEADQVFDGIAAALAQYDLPDLNGLVMKKATKPQGLVRDIVWRAARDRTASTLSSAELASLFHLPLPTTETPNILWRGAKAAPAPPDIPQSGVMLGTNAYRGINTPVYLAEDDRRRHLYMIGQTGTGKTTLFLNMIVQDMVAGRGVGVVDPHGDLIEDILLNVPEERIQDVILFDPRDTERPLGFNILEVKNEEQKDLVVNEVVQILQKLAARLNPESIGPMFEHYLRNALLALAEDAEATLIDVPRMFVDQKFRDKILIKVDNPTVRQFWDQEFAQSQRGQMSADMLSYVISKLGRFVSNRTMRNLIGQATSSFDMREVMDKRKILLCNLSKGSLGDINSDLLGFVLVSKLQIAALGRADVPEDQRPDFYLYLDEFQNFTTDSIATILSEARKYRLNLNLTHQFIQQLDDQIKESVFGNVGTVVSYRVGVEDAEFLAKQFEPVFTEYDLVNLERFTMCARLLVAGTPRRPFSLAAAAPPRSGDASVRERVRKQSREIYGRSVQEVEERILRRFKYEGGKKNSPGGDDTDYLSESLFDVS